MRCLTGIRPSESSRAMEDSVMEPIASCGGGNLTRKPAKAAASRLKVNRILVPTNFSATSLGAVRYAASLAEWFGASVCLPHVVPCDAFTHNLQHWGLLGRHDEVVGMGERLLIKLSRGEQTRTDCVVSEAGLFCATRCGGSSPRPALEEAGA